MKALILVATVFIASIVPIYAQEVYPTAILPFQERGASMKGQGQNIADIVFAGLVIQENIMLVERKDLEKILDETALNLSGVVKSSEAIQIGQLTGAKILITGSVFEVGKKTYLVAKVIGTETSKVLGVSVNGQGELSDLAEQLAEKVGESVTANAGKLVAKRVTREDRVAAVRTQLDGKKLPTILVSVEERHIGARTIDPAAETELIYYLKELGATVIDAKDGKSANADYRIVGEGISEFAGRIKDLTSVKARLEVKVLDRDGKIVAIDRQTAVNVDLVETIAGKSALQEASARIAARIIPKLATAAAKQ